MPADHAHVYVPDEVADLVGSAAGWWFSIVDTHDPDDHRALGVWIAGDVDMVAASQDVWHRLGRLPDLEIMALPLPAAKLREYLPGYRNRLLSKADLGAIGENTKTLGELGLA